MTKKKIMVKKSSIAEFRSTGLVVFVNMILHIFGWAIAFEIGANGEALNMFPARTKFRGFDEKSQTQAYIKISKFMVKNSAKLLKESMQ